MKDYYLNFQILLKTTNLKLKDLQSCLNLTQPALSLKIHGKRPFKIDEILKIIKFFDSDFETIFITDLSQKIKEVI